MGKKGAKSSLTLKELRAASIRLQRASETLAASILTLEGLEFGLDDLVPMKNVWSVEHGVDYIERGAKSVRDAAEALTTEKLSELQDFARNLANGKGKKKGSK